MALANLGQNGRRCFVHARPFFIGPSMARPARFVERVVWRRVVGEACKLVGLFIAAAKFILGAAYLLSLSGSPT